MKQRICAKGSIHLKIPVAHSVQRLKQWLSEWPCGVRNVSQSSDSTLRHKPGANLPAIDITHKTMNSGNIPNLWTVRSPFLESVFWA